MESDQPTLDVLTRRLEYDTVGRVRNQYTQPIPVEFGTIFGYDGLNRLVRDTMGMIESDQCTFDSNNGYECPQPSVDSVRSYAYDSGGNLTRDSLYRVYNGTYTLATGSYNAGNRITAFNGCSYQTDYDGNVTQRSGCGSTINFYWSSENRLDSMSVGGQKVRHYHDAYGRLVKRDVYGTVKYYWWDGANLYAEINSSGGKLAEYSYYPGLDDLHAVVLGGSNTPYFAHVDALGNVIGLVDDAKLLKRRYQYDDWGKLVWDWDGLGFSNTDRARFKGALWMGPEVDFYYMRNRWYETHSGRFLSEDPIGLSGGVNPYVFTGNNPVSGADPTGLSCVQVTDTQMNCSGSFDWSDIYTFLEDAEEWYFAGVGGVGGCNEINA